MSKKTIRYAGEVFSGYNKPKKTPGKSKKFAVLVKIKTATTRSFALVIQTWSTIQRVAKKAPAMATKKDGLISALGTIARQKDKTTPGYWSCNYSW